MEFNPNQLTIVSAFIIVFFGIYKIKNLKVKLLLCFAFIILYLFNPIKNKQENISSIEYRNEVVIEIPEKVISNRTSFEEEMRKEHLKLKKQSGEYYEETSN